MRYYAIFTWLYVFFVTWYVVFTRCCEFFLYFKIFSIFVEINITCPKCTTECYARHWCWHLIHTFMETSSIVYNILTYYWNYTFCFINALTFKWHFLQASNMSGLRIKIISIVILLLEQLMVSKNLSSNTSLSQK